MATLGNIEQFNPDLGTMTAYLERVDLFFVANNVPDDRKAAVLLSVIGGTIYGRLRDLLSPDKPSDKSYEQLKTTLIEHYEQKPITIAERFHFHKRHQQPTETIAEFVAELKRLARTCEFGDFLDQALRDQFVCGVAHAGTLKRLLTESTLTLAKAIEIATSAEAAEKNIQEFKSTDAVVVGKVETETPSRSCFHCGRTNHTSEGCWAKDVVSQLQQARPFGSCL